MTCPRTSVSVSGMGDKSAATRVSGKNFVPRLLPTLSLPRIIERVFETHSKQLLVDLTGRSLKSIRGVFFPEGPSPEVDALEGLYRNSHTTLVALFFLLLNVDADLKDFVLTTEAVVRRDKVTRFMLDLKRHAVLRFFSDDTVSVSAFVQNCRETYLLS